MTKLKETIDARIESVTKSERVTKAELSALSREILQYVLTGKGRTVATYDVQVVNRLLGVLTPMNQRTAVLYFSHFLPFAFDENDLKFGKLQQKKKDKFIVQAREWLEDDDNDIWLWAARNVKVEKKPIDWSKRISSDIQKALNAEGDDSLTPKEVMVAVLAGGIQADDLTAMLELIIEEAEQKEEQPLAAVA